MGVSMIVDLSVTIGLHYFLSLKKLKNFYTNKCSGKIASTHCCLLDLGTVLEFCSQNGKNQIQSDKGLGAQACKF
jgi:hypothetical protein